MKSKKTKIIAFIGLLALFLAIGYYYAQVRWINADEGAHLSDVQLIGEGLVPFVDFQSREPVYVYILYLGSKIVGHSLFKMRLIPFLFFMIDGLLLYFLASELYDKKIGIGASLVFYLLPFSFVFSVLIKTELFALCFTMLAFILFVRYCTLRKRRLAFGVGIFSLLAFYARLADIGTFAALFILWIIFSLNDKKFLDGFFVFLFSYIGGAALVLLGYLPAISFEKAFFSNLNPFFLFLKPLLKHFPTSFLNSLGLEKLPVVKQEFSRSMIMLTRIIDMNLFLLVGGGIAFLYLLYKYFIVKKMDFSITVLSFWAGTYLLFYGYYLFQRGVYSQYFTEILPPLIILFLGLFQRFCRDKNLGISPIICYFYPVLFVCMFFIFRIYNVPYPNRFLYLFFATVIAAILIVLFNQEIIWKKISVSFGLIALVGLIFWFLQTTDWHNAILKKVILILLLFALLGAGLFLLEGVRLFSLRNSVSFFVFVFFLASVAISGGVSGNFLSYQKYECTWSPNTLQNVTKILKTDHSNYAILSGAMIWSYEAGKQPFMNITHPLKFNGGFPPEVKKKIERYFLEHPPKYVLADGYLSKNYFKYIPNMQKAFSRNYHRLTSVENVTIYLRDSFLQ